MAGKRQNFDNTEFKNIAGNFSSYDDLTLNGKKIVNEIITKCSGKKGYPHKKVYYVLFNIFEVNIDTIKYWLDYYSAKYKEDSLPTINTVRKFLTIIKQLSVALVTAHKEGVRLFKAAQDGHYYLTPVDKCEIDKMNDNGASAQEIIAVLQHMIDDSAK
ncbi:hypothetical protein N5E15_05055 [Pantoea stewartii]|uniref:hypothetical protein n=1 Tax=Pantoea stewartii TaxID=66269 RepID=UPI0021D51193|nr:hypothetical protein [Pantoea stewartii]MCU7365980.1 hypothetical protein [Pantoea stewartii]